MKFPQCSYSEARRITEFTNKLTKQMIDTLLLYENDKESNRQYRSIVTNCLINKTEKELSWLS